MHFTIGVISEEIRDFEEMLAEYSEHNRDVFMSESGDLADKYENDTIDMLKKPNGEIVYPWNLYGEEEENAKEIEMTFKELFPKEEDFYTKYAGLSKHNGEYGYWGNPIGKWDWYQVGGRWKGLLLVKDDVDEVITGDKGVFPEEDKPKIDGYKWVDGARLKDIEWELMEDLKQDELSKHWDEKHKEDNRMITGIKAEESKEDYLKRVTPFITYSVLSNAGWIDVDEEYKNDKYYDKYIKNEDQEKFLVVVDYHN